MTWLSWLIATPCLVATLVILIEVVLGALPSRRRICGPWKFASTVVLVPAHDEAAGIGAMLETLFSRLPDGMRVVVVADNCSDQTAAIARANGAEVLERTDVMQRGKGYALAYGRDWLAVQGTPPDCVIVQDADTIPMDDGLPLLAERAIATQRPVQAVYLLEPKISDPASVRFSAAAFLVKNLVRLEGAHRLGAPALLTGSGMAFPWQSFLDLPLATGHIAEDLMLGVESTLRGKPPMFCSDVRVAGSTSSVGGTTTQRRRWESGTRDVARNYSGKLLVQGAQQCKFGMWWNALQLITPPLIPLLMLDVIALAFLAGLQLLGGSPTAFVVLATVTTAAIVTIPVAIALHGRRDLLTGWRDIPRYILWKAGLSLAVFIRRERQWIRTERD